MIQKPETMNALSLLLAFEAQKLVSVSLEGSVG